MRITIRSKTLGSHTHLAIWTNGGQSCEDFCLRNEDVGEFLTRLQPTAVNDVTPEHHEPVAALWQRGESYT